MKLTNGDADIDVHGNGLMVLVVMARTRIIKSQRGDGGLQCDSTTTTFLLLLLPLLPPLLQHIALCLVTSLCWTSSVGYIPLPTMQTVTTATASPHARTTAIRYGARHTPPSRLRLPLKHRKGKSTNVPAGASWFRKAGAVPFRLEPGVDDSLHVSRVHARAMP